MLFVYPCGMMLSDENIKLNENHCQIGRLTFLYCLLRLDYGVDLGELAMI